ncbi:MAG: hypothetical protein RPU39_13760 [Candidatus Sedimenticola sp. (ex Thyasira tokunagai)]
MASIIKDDVVIATCDHLPDVDDLETRGEEVIPQTGAVGQIWDGSVFSNPEPVPHIVTTITKIQCKRQFVALGKWGDFKALRDSDPEMAEDWELTTELPIDSPFINTVAQEMTLDKQAFFNAAGKL